MQNIIVFKSDSDTPYLYILSKKRLILVNEVIFDIFKIVEKTDDPLSVTINDLVSNLNHKSSEIQNSYKWLINLVKLNGFLWYPEVSSNYNAINIKREFYSNPHIVFEVTEKCNLSCKYCSYGKYYSGYDERQSKILSFEKAKKIIDYIFNNDEGIEVSETTISFYGGEPLLNISFIKRVVDYCINRYFNKEIKYTITTNATLLNKHLDFLIAKDFQIFISLDGNRFQNSYRVFKNGKESYNKTFENAKLIKNNYSEFFYKNVNFLTVQHNRNKNSDINQFFKSNFDKQPMISEIVFDSIVSNKIDEFRDIFLSDIRDDNIENKKDNRRIVSKEIDVNANSNLDLLLFLNHLDILDVNTFYDIFFKSNNQIINYTTGTCIPFQKKIFITTNGKILPCESISHKFSYGFVDEVEVKIDFAKIASRHNAYINSINKQCKRCYRITTCEKCIYVLKGDNDDNKCDEYLNKSKFEKILSMNISLLELNENSVKNVYETRIE